MSKSQERNIYNVREAKAIPGVGKYDVDKGKNLIWKGPPSRRR